MQAIEAKKNPAISRKNEKRVGFIKEIHSNFSLYSMAIPAVVLLFLFCYLPLMGLILAFKDFQFDKGIFGSDWSTPLFNNFIFLLSSGEAFRAIKNTVMLNAMFIISGIIFEVGIALLLNEIGNKTFKKITQSFTFLPYFVSWIVVGVFAYNLLNYETGGVNTLLSGLGFQKVDWYSEAGIWPLLLLFFNRWKLTGYGAVVYLATLSGIDESYYEAAKIDGATRWHQTKYITIPLLMPTVIILTLLSIGKIMNADFGMFYSLVGEASVLYPTTDVIDTFVYRNLRKIGDVGMASATGFLQSTLAFVLVMGSNLIARKIDKDSALF